MKVSCVQLCDPMGYTVHGLLQARILEWVAFPFSKGSSQHRNWTQVSCTALRFFTSWATREANVWDLALIPGLGRSPGKGKGYPFQYSGLENSMRCIVHGVGRVWHDWVTFTFTFPVQSSISDWGTKIHAAWCSLYIHAHAHAHACAHTNTHTGWGENIAD